MHKQYIIAGPDALQRFKSKELALLHAKERAIEGPGKTFVIFGAEVEVTMPIQVTQIHEALNGAELARQSVQGAAASGAGVNDEASGARTIRVHIELPAYKSHKVVRAAKITRIDRSDGGGADLQFDEIGGHLFVDSAWMQKHGPARGGYFVSYEDGYTSFSPKGAFEEGYARVKS